MHTDGIPVVWASSVISKHRTVFETSSKEVTVDIPGGVMRQILVLCNGRRNVAEVIDEISKEWDGETVFDLLESLFRERIIVDGRNLGEEFWKVVVNPAPFPVKVSEETVSSLVAQGVERQRSEICEKVYYAGTRGLASLVTRRKSTRTFSGQKISFKALIALLWSAYGECVTEDGRFHRTVPSAGALYPLTIHTVLFKKMGDYEPGIYKICYGLSGSIGFRFISDDILKFVRSLLNPMVIQQGVHGIVVVSGSFLIGNQKYGNRSVLYASLEAGHAAQNILLEGVRRRIATLEIGGFIDELLSDSIGLAEGYHPLTLIAFGKEREAVVSGGVASPEIDWAIPLSKGYRPGFANASVRLSPERSWSHGRDPSPDLALIKAMSEAREWTACGCIPELAHARYDELDDAIDPREVIRFHPRQYGIKGFPFAPLDKWMRYDWATGYDLDGSGKECHILADHVFFPYFPKRPYYCYSNSSGCAAHPDELVAIEKGTLELIERDAFMNAYLGRLDMSVISEDTLPSNIGKRIKELRTVGFRVWCVDHSLDLAPVLFVFVQNEALAYTGCASCSSFDQEYALDHAFTEVEASVLHRLQNGVPTAIRPQEVVWPNDHGRLYAQKAYFHRADFLVGSGRIVSFAEAGAGAARSWRALRDRFRKKGWRHLVVPLTLSEGHGGNGELHIVRVLVPGMTQLTFGYRQEPAGMRRIYEVAEKFGRGKLSYRDLTKFPHPFE